MHDQLAYRHQHQQLSFEKVKAHVDPTSVQGLLRRHAIGNDAADVGAKAALGQHAEVPQLKDVNRQLSLACRVLDVIAK
eukprot:11468648-Karenia_brevis.AAC.1